MPTARQIAQSLDRRDPALMRVLRSIYGSDERLLDDRRRMYLRLANRFLEEFDPTAQVAFVRSPGRVNLMGRHVDHRGGHTNTISLNVEILAIAQRREDDTVMLRNLDHERYPDASFSIGDEIPPSKLATLPEWDRWTMAKHARRHADGQSTPWQVYVEAAAVAFQDQLRRPDGGLAPALRGMNMVVTGDIPPRAGLSSSSALFVTAARTLLHLNGIEMADADFVDACGRGEWYVGTRGGSGDHAAIVYGRQAQLCHTAFFPTTVEYVDFPQDYSVIVCNSHEDAHKAGNARDTFNSRVAAYELGLWILLELHPELRDRVQHLRDICPDRLQAPTDVMYSLLSELPVSITRAEVLSRFPALREQCDVLFAGHQEPEEGYRVRDVCLFGIAECLRARRCVEFLQQGDVETFGRLMSVSHDGDRVAQTGPAGARPYRWTATEKRLSELSALARRGEASADLMWQPGGYACSTKNIDHMVDIALRQRGALGAQLSGAGLGGSMMILAARPFENMIAEAMECEYYAARKLPRQINICVPVEGDGVLPF